MKHVIKKQLLLVTIPPGMDPFRIQHEAERFSREVLMPALDRIFNELSGEDEVIHLSQLHLDLGRIGAALLESRTLDEYLYDLIKEQVRQTIEKELRAHPSARQSPRENVLSQWWYYMQHGRLPWNADPVTEDWYGKVLEMFSVDYPAITELRRVLAREPAVLMRISVQHDDWFLEKLLTVLVSVGQQGVGEAIDQACVINQLLEEKYKSLTIAAQGFGDNPVDGAIADSGDRSARVLRETPVPGPRQPEWKAFQQWARRHAAFLRLSGVARKKYLWRWLLTEAASSPSEFAVAGGMKILLDWIWDDPVLMRLVLADDRVAGSTNQLAGLLQRRYDAGAGSLTRPVGEDGSNSMPMAPESVRVTPPSVAGPADRRSDAGKAGARREGPEDIEQRMRAVESGATDQGLIQEETIHLPNAGIILLHPFLPTLFSRLGFWDGSDFRDPGARQRAIGLLHFLATGERQEVPEYQLVLPKLMCGYPLEMPVPADIVLTDEECGECLTLLRSAIARWEKLAGTSIDGFREGFLRRDGQLFRKDDRLILKVQSAGIDVLLDYLPWNLSLVKLPWVKEMLYVDWR